MGKAAFFAGVAHGFAKYRRQLHVSRERRFALNKSGEQIAEEKEAAGAQAARNLEAFNESLRVTHYELLDDEQLFDLFTRGFVCMRDIEMSRDGVWSFYDYENWPGHKGWTQAEDGREAFLKALKSAHHKSKIV